MAHNREANWSGYHFYNNLYYALFHVLCTWGVCGLLLADQDVSINKEKYVRDNHEPNKEADGYDPNYWTAVGKGNCSTICNGELFEREKVLAAKGVSVNSDGSTNNMAHFYWYCRDSLSKAFYKYMILQIIYSYVAGFFTYYLAVYAFGDIINSAGTTNDYHNGALICVYINAVTHYVLVLIETHNWNI